MTDEVVIRYRVTDADLQLAAARAARRLREEAAAERSADPITPPRLTGAPPGPPHAPGEASEPCPDCGAPIALDEAWCRSCGSSRGIVTTTPREDYLRGCLAALELLRQTSRRVRPLPETRRAEVELEAAVGRLREGCEL